MQLLVRQTMLAAGGYWRPLAAVARLLEELGELAELLGQATPSRAELAGELADLWIITTALADQYLTAVPEPASSADAGGSDLASLLAAAGPVARIVNHYDGPKTPRAGTAMPSLGDAIAAFHGGLAALAGALGVDLAGAVGGKLAAIAARGDLVRFKRSGHDPSTAPLLARHTPPGPAGERARLWAGPDWREDSPEQNACAVAGHVEAFAKAARTEGIEGFLIAGPPQPGPREDWTGKLLAQLGASLGAGAPVGADAPAGAEAPAGADAPAGAGMELRVQGLTLRAQFEEGADGEIFIALRPIAPYRGDRP